MSGREQYRESIAAESSMGAGNRWICDQCTATRRHSEPPHPQAVSCIALSCSIERVPVKTGIDY